MQSKLKIIMQSKLKIYNEIINLAINDRFLNNDNNISIFQYFMNNKNTKELDINLSKKLFKKYIEISNIFQDFFNKNTSGSDFLNRVIGKMKNINYVNSNMEYIFDKEIINTFLSLKQNSNGIKPLFELNDNETPLFSKEKINVLSRINENSDVDFNIAVSIMKNNNDINYDVEKASYLKKAIQKTTLHSNTAILDKICNPQIKFNNNLELLIKVANRAESSRSNIPVVNEHLNKMFEYIHLDNDEYKKLYHELNIQFNIESKKFETNKLLTRFFSDNDYTNIYLKVDEATKKYGQNKAYMNIYKESYLESKDRGIIIDMIKFSNDTRRKRDIILSIIKKYPQNIVEKLNQIDLKSPLTKEQKEKGIEIL